MSVPLINTHLHGGGLGLLNLTLRAGCGMQLTFLLQTSLVAIVQLLSIRKEVTLE